MRPRTNKRTGESSIMQIFNAVGSNPIPDTFKLGRRQQLQVPKWENTIFETIEAEERGVCLVRGKVDITEYDFVAFQMAVGQALYNQSFQSGNLDTNSGLTKEVAQQMKAETGHTYYMGNIVVTLNQLCLDGYGNTSKKSRKSMAAIIDTIDRTPVSIDFPNGDRLELRLAAVMGKYYSKKDGSLTYWLTLSPIFCEDVKRNFGEHPQDIALMMSKIVSKKKSAAHLHLYRLLSIQDNRRKKGIVFTIPHLIEELGMEKEYKIKRGATEARLLSICDDMQKLGKITHYEKEHEYKRGKKWVSKIRFYLNPDFVKKRLGQGEETEQAEP